jgi:thioredoxin 1
LKFFSIKRALDKKSISNLYPLTHILFFMIGYPQVKIIIKRKHMNQAMLKSILITTLLISSAFAQPTVITSLEQLDGLLKKHAIVVAKVSAPWCPACVRSQKPFDQLAEDPDLANAVFVTIDFDSNQAIAKKYGVEGLPTFLFFHNGQLAKKEAGASDALKRQVKDIISSFGAAASTPAATADGQVKKNEEASLTCPAATEELVKEAEAPASLPTKTFFEQAYDSVVEFFNSVSNTIHSWFK